MAMALGVCPGSVPVVGAACTAVSGAAGKVAGAGVDAVFDAASTWVSSGAVWLLGEVGHVLSATTSVDLGAPWFAAHEAVMAALAAAVVLPMTCCAVMQAVYRQSASMLARTFLVHLPLCLLLTGVAVTLVRLGLAVTDELCAQVLSGAGVDSANLFSGLTVFFAGTAVAAGPAVPSFVVFVGALVAALAALVLWLELVVRAAAVSAAVLFLPLAMAALVWPAVSHWCRRLADTLVALVLSKLVVAAVLSLAVGALAGGLGLSGSGGGGFAAVVTGIALLVIATMSPFTLLRLVPAVEAGAVAHLESTRHRLQGAARAPIRSGGNLALDLARARGGAPDGAGGTDGVAVGAADGGASAISMVAGSERGFDAVAVAAGTGGAGAGMAVAGAASGAASGGATGAGAASGEGVGGPPRRHGEPGAALDTATTGGARGGESEPGGLPLAAAEGRGVEGGPAEGRSAYERGRSRDDPDARA